MGFSILGKNVEGCTSLDQALAVAGVDWTVSPQPVDVCGRRVDGYQAITRDDTGTVLSIMGSKYTPLQNRKAFEVLQNFADEGLKWFGMGSVQGGRKVYATAKLPGNIAVTGHDHIDKYLFFFNSHDGRKVNIYFTPFRPACTNQLRFIATNCDCLFSASHTSGMHAKLAGVKTLIKEIRYQEEIFTRDMAKMIEFRTTALDVEKVLNQVFNHGREEIRPVLRQEIAVVENLLECGLGTELEGVKGSAYGLYNAITEYADHYARTRAGTDDSRLQSLFFGTLNGLKERAYTETLALVS